MTSSPLPAGVGPDRRAQTERPSEPPTPAGLLRLFFGVALSGIGGGLPAHTRRALEVRGWMTDLEFAETYTLAQLTPGPNAVNLAAMVGARLSGKRAALLSVVGIMVPGLAAMMAASVLLAGLPGGLPPALQSALRGAACAALGVLVTAALPVVRVGTGVRGGWPLVLAAFLTIGVLRFDVLPTLVVLLGVGLALNRPRRAAP